MSPVVYRGLTVLHLGNKTLEPSLSLHRCLSVSFWVAIALMKHNAVASLKVLPCPWCLFMQFHFNQTAIWNIFIVHFSSWHLWRSISIMFASFSTSWIVFYMQGVCVRFLNTNESRMDSVHVVSDWITSSVFSLILCVCVCVCVCVCLLALLFLPFKLLYIS